MIFIKFFKTFFIIIYWIRKINWINFFKIYDRNSINVILISFINRRYSNEIVSWDFSIINYHIINNINFRISFTYSNLKNSIIFWSPSKYFVSSKIKNYTKELTEIAKGIEDNNNKIFPSSNEIKLYENKSYMHEFFLKKNIRSPLTKTFKNISEINEKKLKFPIILKGEYSSGSSDVYKFNTYDSLINFLNKSSYVKIFDNIIIQEFLNIRMDLRVTIVDDQIVLFYWRKNPSKNWLPTASSFGSKINFNDFPIKWEKFIIEQFKKLNLPMGAFDIAWNNDDLSKKPYILEFSPRFSPNPPMNFNMNYSYGEWKKKIFIKNPYWRIQADFIYEINNRYINFVLNKIGFL